MPQFASLLPILQAGAGAAAAADKAPASAMSSTMSMLWSIGPFVLLFVVFYFFIIRPQNKKQKETKKMLEGLRKGDRIVTIGGIHGQVTSVKDNTVIVKVDDTCKLEFLRSAISTVVSREDEGAEKAASEPEKK